MAAMSAAASSSSEKEEERDNVGKDMEQEKAIGGIALDFGREYMESALWELEWLPYTIRQALARSPGAFCVPACVRGSGSMGASHGPSSSLPVDPHHYSTSTTTIARPNSIHQAW